MLAYNNFNSCQGSAPSGWKQEKNTGFSLLDNWMHALSSESSLLSNSSPPSS